MTPAILLYHGKVGIGYSDLAVEQLEVAPEPVSVCESGG